MSGDPARRRATYEDLLAVADGKVAEIIDGELVVSPRPGGPHTAAATAITIQIGGAFSRGGGGPLGGWWIMAEPEVHFGAEILVPDLAGWRRERMPVYPEGPFVEMAPDWVCEVISSGTQGRDRVHKVPLYAAMGVGHAWLVDPSARTLEVLRLEGAHWVLAGAFDGDAEVRAEPFESFALPLRTLWDRGA